MRTILLSLAILLLVTATRAQESGKSAETLEVTAGSRDSLPDAPKPKAKPLVRDDENTPCPGGAGKPCALLGGRRYFADSWKMSQYDQNWAQAMRHPAIFAVAGLLIAASAYDIEGTNSCLRTRGCREANPLMPKTANRGWQYSAAMSVDAFGIYSLGRLKQRGRGNLGFAVIAAASLAHVCFGAAGFNASHTVKSH
jgi:hypothetical protein